jgi:amino acid permease
MSTMTPRRAFWEAFATVCVPNVVIWSTLFYLVARNWQSDARLGLVDSFVLFAALPVPLIFPVYKHYRNGARTEGKSISRIANAILAILFAAAGTITVALCILGAVRARIANWGFLFGVAMAMMLFAVAVEYARRFSNLTSTSLVQAP